VSAKAVHQALGVGRDFSNWLKSRISRYGFEAGADYWKMGDLDSPCLTSTILTARRQLFWPVEAGDEFKPLLA
jgi:hypothetical protein